MTYFTYAQRIVLIWDSFVDAKQKYNFNFSKETHGVNYKLREFYQQLDFAFMGTRSSIFSPEDPPLENRACRRQSVLPPREEAQRLCHRCSWADRGRGISIDLFSLENASIPRRIFSWPSFRGSSCLTTLARGRWFSILRLANI